MQLVAVAAAATAAAPGQLKRAEIERASSFERASALEGERCDSWLTHARGILEELSEQATQNNLGQRSYGALSLDKAGATVQVPRARKLEPEFAMMTMTPPPPR